MDAVFDLTRPAGQILTIVLLLVPGLNASWLIEKLVGPTPVRGTERLFRAVSLSILVYGLGSFWLISVVERLERAVIVTPRELVVGGILLLFVVPGVLAAGWARIHSWAWPRTILRFLTSGDPSPTSWDYVFKQRRSYLVRIRLRSGAFIGGLFGPSSSASFDREAQDLYLETEWRLAGDGTFLGPSPGSRGLLVQRKDVEAIEFEDIEAEAAGDGEE